MDSTALRASWNPGANWSLQASWADVESPEQLEPEVDEERLSASALYGRELDGGRSWSATLAWGHKNPNEGDATNALRARGGLRAGAQTGSSSRAPNGSRRTNSARTTTTSTRSPSCRSALRREFPLTERVRLGLGALYTLNDVDARCAPSYGGSPRTARWSSCSSSPAPSRSRRRRPRSNPDRRRRSRRPRNPCPRRGPSGTRRRRG